MTCQQIGKNSDTVLAQGFQCEVVALSNILLLRAIRLTPTRADAEDLVQETLLHAFKGFDKFEPGTNVKAWLYRIMRNRWITSYRRSEARPVEDLQDSMTDGVLSGAAAPIWAEHRSAEDKVLSRMPDPAVKAALATVSPAIREVLYYKLIEGYTYRDIAALMNVPVGTVMSRLHRGRERIRDQLSELCPTAPPYETTRQSR